MFFELKRSQLLRGKSTEHSVELFKYFDVSVGAL